MTHFPPNIKHYLKLKMLNNELRIKDKKNLGCMSHEA